MLRHMETIEYPVADCCSLTTCWTGPLARLRSPRPVNVSVGHKTGRFMRIAHKFPKPTVSFDLTTSTARKRQVSDIWPTDAGNGAG
jgi:hypothetical protein